MKKPNPIILSCVLAAVCAIGDFGRAGTITIEGNQIVTGNQTVNSNQTVNGTLMVSNQAGTVGLDVIGPAAQIAGARFRDFGATGPARWIQIARIGGADLTNAVVSGRVLAQGPGAGCQYVADFAFPGPGQNPYSPVLVEMGNALIFHWEVRSSGSDTWLWFKQCLGSKFANFLYAEANCTSTWETGSSPSGTLIWSSASSTDSRQSVKAGGLTLTSGLTLPDGTLLNAKSNMTATALVDGSNTLLSASGGRLAFGAPADFSGEVTLPDSIALGTNGITLSADRWDMVDSSFVQGATSAWGLAASVASSIRGMAADTNGNQYVFGGFAGTMTLANTTIQSGTSGGESDRAGFVAKFDVAGTPQWIRAFPATNYVANGTNGEWLVDIVTAKTDAAGNLYFGGTLRAPSTIGGSTRTPLGGGDGFVTSLAPNGNFRWFRQFGGTNASADSIVDLDVNAAGNTIFAGGTEWGYATYQTTYYDDSNGYVVKLNGYGTTIAEWSLGGRPDDSNTWVSGHESSEIGGDFYWSTAIDHVCVCGDGVAVSWLGAGTKVRKLGGTSEWSHGSGWSITRDILPLSGGDILELRGVEWYMFEPSAAIAVSSGGTVTWCREDGIAWDPYMFPFESKALLHAATAPDGSAILAWFETWWLYEDPDYIQYTRKIIEKVESNGSVAWTIEIPLNSDVTDLAMDGAGALHAFGTHSGTMDLGAAGSLPGDGTFHLRFSGTSTNSMVLSDAPDPAGTLVAIDGFGDSIALTCSGPPPSYVHTDEHLTSLAIPGYLDVNLGIRLDDGTLVGSASDIAALGPVKAASTSGNYWLSGYLGIGTNAPVANLDVVGDARVSGSMTLNSNLTVASLMRAQGGMVVTNGDLVVYGNLIVYGTNSHIPPGGDVSMGAFTNGPAQ